MERLSTPNKVAGVKQAKNAVLQGKASVVYLADDVAPGVLDKLIALCKEKGVETASAGTAKELAKHCKIDVPCSAAAVLND